MPGIPDKEEDMGELSLGDGVCLCVCVRVAVWHYLLLWWMAVVLRCLRLPHQSVPVCLRVATPINSRVADAFILHAIAAAPGTEMPVGI